jgi:ABC-type nitrate/sulfonate/bicarbonate transport system substrate-binding protein
MAAGQADLGLVPLLDFINLRSEGREMKLLMAVVQTPLNAIITSAESGIKNPLDLEGRSIATTGILGDEIVLQALLKAHGGDATKVDTINLGFNTIQALASSRVDAAFGFWNAEGVQYQESHDAVVLRSFEQGIPAYPELVLFTSDDRIAEKEDAIRRFIEITLASYESLLADPEEALIYFAASVDGYEIESARPYYDILLPVFQYQAASYGLIDRQTLIETMDWLSESGFPQYQLPVDTLLAPGLTVIAP